MKRLVSTLLVLGVVYSSGCATGGSSAVSAQREPAEAVPGSLGALMGQMGGVQMFLAPKLKDGADPEPALKDVAAWKALAKQCRAKPAPQTVTSDEQEKDYFSYFDRLDAQLDQLEQNIKDGKMDEARETFTGIKSIQKEAHTKFRPKM